MLLKLSQGVSCNIYLSSFFLSKAERSKYEMNTSMAVSLGWKCSSRIAKITIFKKIKKQNEIY